MSLKRSWTGIVGTLVCLVAFRGPGLVGQDTVTPGPGLSTTEATPAVPQTYPVRGKVLDSSTRQPIARALVNAGQDAALTDNDGNFAMQLPAGTSQIALQRPGYGAGHSFEPHLIAVGADTPAMEFYLKPDALITGQITLPGSDIADGVRVMVFRQSTISGRQQWVVQGVAMTNSEGTYRLGGLQPGSYLLYTQLARDEDSPPAPGSTTYGYAPVYYPGVADPAAAGVLRLTAGQHAQADFSLTREPFHSVTVTVTNEDIGRGVGLQLKDATGRMLGFPMRRGLQSGTTQVNVPNGSYYLEARSGFGRGGGGGGEFGRVDFKVAGAPISGLRMTLLPLHALPVTVRKEFTQSSETQGTIGTSDGGAQGGLSAGLNLMLTPADASFGQGFGNRGLQPVSGVNDGSSFELESVSPGRYWVSTFAYRGYVSSITSGGVDLAREALVVGPGSTSAPIEITLRDDTGAITGQIVQSAATATGSVSTTTLGELRRQWPVYAIPLFATSGQLMQGGVDPSGTFTMRNLAPGGYRVVAFDHQQEIDFHSPEGLAKYASAGQTVTVEAGGTASVQLDSVVSTDGDSQ